MAHSSPASLASLQGLPLELRPSGIESSGPLLRVQRVKGDSRALDVTVVHSFR